MEEDILRWQEGFSSGWGDVGVTSGLEDASSLGRGVVCQRLVPEVLHGIIKRLVDVLAGTMSKPATFISWLVSSVVDLGSVYLSWVEEPPFTVDLADVIR